MGWFRSNRDVVVWLAFFALACQLLLSFGHVHVGKFSGGSAEWAAAEIGAAPADVPPSSPQKNPTGLAGDFCAICANINLAAKPSWRAVVSISASGSSGPCFHPEWLAISIGMDGRDDMRDDI